MNCCFRNMNWLRREFRVANELTTSLSLETEIQKRAVLLSYQGGGAEHQYSHAEQALGNPDKARCGNAVVYLCSHRRARKERCGEQRQVTENRVDCILVAEPPAEIKQV